MWKAKDGLGIAKLGNVRMHVYVCTSHHVAPLARCAVSMHQCNMIYATCNRTGQMGRAESRVTVAQLL